MRERIARLVGRMRSGRDSWIATTDATPVAADTTPLFVHEGRLAEWIEAAERACLDRTALDGMESEEELRLLEPQFQGTRAIIQIRGLIVTGVPGFIEAQGLATDPRRITAQLRRLATDFRSAITELEIHVDSPGGFTTGVETLAETIRQLPPEWRVVARIGGLAASAAYWAVAAADEITARELTSEVGSVGAFVSILDASEAFSQAGLQQIVLSSGDLKGAFVLGTRPTEAQIQAEQRLVNQVADVFAGFVARERRLSDQALAEVRRGGTFLARDALALGLIDSIETEAQDEPQATQGPVMAPPAQLTEETQTMTIDANAILGKLSDAERSAIEAHFAGEPAKPDPVASADPEIKRMLEEQASQLARQEAKILELTEAKVSALYAAEAAAVGALPGYGEERVAQALRRADDAGFGQDVRDLLATAHKVVSLSDLTKIKGSIESVEGGALDQLRAKATEISTARGVTFGEAYRQAIRENPSLYTEARAAGPVAYRQRG